jgi:membrane-bound lytic murein transglycosylase A
VSLGRTLAVCLALAAFPAAPAAPPAQGPFLRPGPDAGPALERLENLGPDLAGSVANSLAYLDRPGAARVYAQRGPGPFSLDRTRRTLARLRDLLAGDPGALRTALGTEFEFHPVAGEDRRGTVNFTGYFEPAYEASRTPTPVYRYPLYQAPRDFKAWPRPHPTRARLVGVDGLQGARGPLQGLELAWLKDRFQAFLVEVQGSARLLLPDGATMTVHNSAITDYPYVSLGRLLAADRKLKGGMGIPSIAAHFEAHPEDVGPYLSRCNRMVFFRETQGAQASGSLEVPLTAGCTLATDKDLFPPGALVLVELDLPEPRADGGFSLRRAQRLALDQDAGGGIKGPGRMDYFVGSGPEAGLVAGWTRSSGRAWYVLLKDQD